MKITKFNLYRYSIPLKSPVKLARTVLHKREGLVLQLTDNSGHSGFGEIAPFPGFSPETLNESETEIKNILASSSDEQLKNSPNRRGEGLAADGGEAISSSISAAFPSIKFGFESALMELKSKSGGVGLARLLNEKARDTISVNGLLAGTKEEILKKAIEYEQVGYGAVKLKVGSGKIEYDIELTKQVRRVIGEKVHLRLDANRAWSINEAEKFCDAVTGLNIDYLEEPVENGEELRKALESKSLSTPIALDETTREISPGELERFNVKAIVLKPTLLGFQSTLDFAEKAHQVGITPVIGSSFESGLGLSILAHIAAAVNTEDIPAGLDTHSWFAKDIMCGSLPVKNGRIYLRDLSKSETVLDSPLLKRVI